MVRVTFPSVLQRHVKCPPVDVEGDTLREVLDAAFALHPQVRGYVLDDAGALRPHLTVFVDGEVVTDRVRLATRLREKSVVDVLQALSGG